MDGARTRRGRFVFVETPTRTLTAPQALSPRRVSKIAVDAARLEHPGGGAWRRRMVTAARQDLWRTLRGHRGLAPAVWIETTADRAMLALAACYLDDARAPQGAQEALATLLRPARLARWRGQSGG